MKSSIFLLLATLPLCARASYHVLTADAQTENQDFGGRSRRSLADQDEVLQILMEESGSGDVTSSEQVVTFLVRNKDASPAQIVLRDVIPRDTILTDFTIHNEAYTYKLFGGRHREREEALREFNEAAAAGYSTVFLGDVDTSSDICPDCKQNYDNDKQSVTSLVNIAPGDTLSVSISFAITLTLESLSNIKDSFKSDSTIEWTYPVSNVQGVIMSPNYPDSYPNNADISWLIRLPPEGGLVIRGNFISFETESCCDHVYVYDGPISTDQVLLVLSGSEPGVNFVSSGPNVLVKFNSDCLSNSGGFSLEYFSVEMEGNVNATEKTPVDQTYLLDEIVGKLWTPGYPMDYPPSSYIVWKIVTLSETIISLQIIDFELASTASLVITDDVTSTSLVSLTGDSEYPTAPLKTSGNKVSIAFRSQPKLVTTYRGFYITYLSASLCSFDLEIEDEDFEWKYLSYPASGNDYSSNLDCTWTISASPGNSIHIQVNNMDLEPVYDFLNIFNGNTQSTSNRIAHISGVGGEYMEYYSTESLVLIQFTTDSSINQKGFQIQYKMYSITTACSSSPVVITSNEGNIQNLNYPSYDYLGYPVQCQWQLQVDEEKVVMITLRQISFPYSVTTIYDGDSTSSSILGSYQYSNYYSGFSVTSSSHQALVVLESDDDYNYNIIYLFTFVAINRESSTQCSGQAKFTTSPGVITSPFYPAYSPTDTNCQWLLQSSSGQKIFMILDYVYIYDYDNLTIYDGSSTSDDVLLKCDNSHGCFSSPIVSSSFEDSLISFSTASQDNSHTTISWFKLKYYFQDDNSLVQVSDANSGIATSPNFPEPYPQSRDDTYNIAVSVGYAIHFYFEVIDFDCCSDYLYIYDGDSTSSPLIDILTYYDSSYKPGTTTGNAMTMLFHSSYYNTYDKGFLMVYEGYKGNISDSNVVYSYFNMEEYDYYSNQYLISPGFASYYPNSFDGLWYFEYSTNIQHIHFDFTLVDIDSSDFVKLYTDFGTDSANLQSTIVGNYYQSGTYQTVYGQRATMWFHSSSKFSGKGFFLRYTAHD